MPKLDLRIELSKECIKSSELLDDLNECYDYNSELEEKVIFHKSLNALGLLCVAAYFLLEYLS